MIMLADDISRHNLSNKATAFFNPKGLLARAAAFGKRAYEYREQQEKMAIAVSEAFSEGKNLCIEAPTGVGKSLAYLVPAIHYALTKKEAVLITTETINLQEQLIDKDLPMLQDIMNLEFKTALAKGRSNYICLRRLKLATGERNEEFLPLSSMMTDVERLSRWASGSMDGSLSDLDFRVDSQLWSCVCCEGGNCSGPKCQYFRNCFYWRARKEWESADIVVANHAMFFTDLYIKEYEGGDEGAGSLLPNYCAVVVDEAHTLEDNAASHLGLKIKNSGMFYFLNRLFNSRNGKGLLLKKGEEALELRKTVSSIQDSASSFFGMLDEILSRHNDSTLRVRNPGIVPDLLSEQFGKLRTLLRDYALIQEDKDFKTELESKLMRCDYFSQGIYNFLNMQLPDSVYWLEGNSSDDREDITLYAAPLNVPELLDKMLFRKSFPVILTSATLTVCKTLDYYKTRTGFSGGPEMVLDSPFDHNNQVKIYLSKTMPEPNAYGYEETAKEQIKHFVKLTHGKAFVLFTSYQMMRKCAKELETFFGINNLKLLVQGKELSRSAMIREFQRDTNSVIFGTTSFWTGVDVPGKALSNVIITKLPFSVPNHPLIEARSEKIRQTGANPFMEYSLPEAVLKFRQGVGRLIRSKTDEGIIAILDKRVISKRYGKHFLDSIPECPTEIC